MGSRFLRFCSALCVLGLGIFTLSCGGGSTSGVGGESRFRIFHALQSQGPISVQFNSKVVVHTLGYASSTGYLKQSGSVHIQVYDANSGTSNLLADRTVSAAGGTETTLLFTQDSTGQDVLLLLPADNTTTPATNMANVRFVNASLQNSGGIDIYLAALRSTFAQAQQAGKKVSIANNPQAVTAGTANEGSVASQYFPEGSKQYSLFIASSANPGIPFTLGSAPSLTVSLGSEWNRTLIFLDPSQVQTLSDLN